MEESVEEVVVAEVPQEMDLFQVQEEMEEMDMYWWYVINE